MALARKAGLLFSGAGECPGGCVHLEILIGKDNASELLPEGTRVLAPCSTCRTAAVENMMWTDQELANNQVAFARFLGDRLMPLYHWAPTNRRAQIIRYGMRPGMRPSTHVSDLDRGWRAPYICFADTPKWAWNLSGGFPGTPAGEWDLWQTTMEKLTEPWVMPADFLNGIHEVRTRHRVFKRNLWLVASR